MTTHQLDQQVRAALAVHDVRYTRGRSKVIEWLARSDGPRSAAELHDDLNGAVPLSSLYRSLAVMSDAGVLAPHHGIKGVTRYELAESLAGHHHHLVCEGCGAVDDIELPDDTELTLERLVTQVAASGGFVATGHALEIDGLCAGCS